MKTWSKKISTLSLTGLLALLLSNCSTVSTSYPLTTDPKAIDKEKFEGAWLPDNAEGVIQVKFADNGVAQLAGLEWEKDHFKLIRGEMYLVKGEEHNFLSVRFEENGKWEDEYFFAPYKFSEQGDLIFWAPNFKEFNKILEKKLLLAENRKNDKSSIVIVSPASDLLKLMDQPGDLNLFDYKSPTILHKVAGEE